MQRTKTILSNSADFIAKKTVENQLWGKSEFLWAKTNASSMLNLCILHAIYAEFMQNVCLLCIAADFMQKCMQKAQNLCKYKIHQPNVCQIDSKNANNIIIGILCTRVVDDDRHILTVNSPTLWLW